MNSSSLQTLLAAEKADALAAMTAAELSQDRADAMDYYLGDMSKDMPAAEGRSRAVSTDVADTIEGLMPSLMDIFAGSDEIVRFEPVGAEDEEAAQQETDYVNHVFMQQNPGFMVLYQQLHEGEWIEPAKKGFIDQCCDCHLVHVIDFAVVDRDKKPIRGAIVQFRLRVDRRKTAASRRKLKFSD